MTESTQKIIDSLLAVPKGSVSTYKDIALRAGIPNGARQVVRVLHSMTSKYNLPWYRIVRADGCIGLQGEGREQQIALLRDEGVLVYDTGKIDLNKYRL